MLKMSEELVPSERGGKVEEGNAHAQARWQCSEECAVQCERKMCAVCAVCVVCAVCKVCEKSTHACFRRPRLHE